MVKEAAWRWIRAYDGFLAESRSPLVWAESPFALPSYVRHAPPPRLLLFPLGWGFDNEVLDSAVFHAAWPPAEQIQGPEGPRLVPSGLDFAAAMGSRLARELLAEQIRKYPPLAQALDRLTARRPREPRSLYEHWIEALGVQWAEEALAHMPDPGRALWRAKRLQTGLASWTTLRHVTVLVNERSAAECAEMGIEPILMRPPRGAVEPDPRSFAAIAALFEEAARRVAAWPQELPGMLPEEPAEARSLKEGLLRRLQDSAAKARRFASIAERQIAGRPLSSSDYEEIYYVGRVAEHNFLVFKSLANKDLALSNPDPVAKIVDVAGGGPSRVPYLLAAVGRPWEWDHVMPFYGRRQIVKGVSYSYYELTSDVLLDDRQWRERLPAQKPPAWIASFLSQRRLPCPPGDPY